MLHQAAALGSGERSANGPVVLVGFAEAYAAIEATWSLREAGFRVAAFTRIGARPALKHVRNVRIFEVFPPELDAKRTTDDVRALIRSLSPDAYLPLDDAAVWIGGKLSDESVTVAGPRGQSATDSLDKELQLARAGDAGLLIPSTQVVSSLRDVRPTGYPVVVKPARALYSVDGHLVRVAPRVCADESEFLRVSSRPTYGNVLIQPFIRGQGEGLFGHVSRTGVVGWSAHRRIRMLNPQGSASSACSSRTVDEGLLGPAERFLRKMGWRGLFMLEFLRDAQGRPWFMELNGRTWGSMALARRRGFEYPAWTVRAALDEDFSPEIPADPPDIFCRNLGMEIVHLAFVLRGPGSAALSDWPRLLPTVRRLLHVSRKDRFYNWKWSEPGVLAADTAKTLTTYLHRAFRPAG